MDPVVVEVFAQLGDQRKQQVAPAGDQSLQSLSQALASPAGGERQAVNERLAVPEKAVA
jgi:hypothetical protein